MAHFIKEDKKRKEISVGRSNISSITFSEDSKDFLVSMKSLHQCTR
uniref:Uncharacterized protein n=1 Tax=Anguilla anguilla TaxID=7936 RepID=A0A0E9VRY1_ANGAN